MIGVHMIAYNSDELCSCHPEKFVDIVQDEFQQN
jgi:hypothetical protein